MATWACFRAAPCGAPTLVQRPRARAVQPAAPSARNAYVTILCSSADGVPCNGAGTSGGSGGAAQTLLVRPSQQSPLLSRLEIHKVVGHNRGRTSPWSPSLPDAHDVLPAFVEQVVNKHLHAPTILDWLDGVYMVLSRQRAGEDTLLSAALPPDAPHLPLHSEPDASYFLLGWCLVNHRLDPRCAAIEFVEVPVEVRRQGMGRALLELLSTALPDQAVLPRDPREDSMSFWLEVSPPALGKLAEQHGLGVARELCVGRLGWRADFLEQVMERHRQAASVGVLSSMD